MLRPKFSLLLYIYMQKFIELFLYNKTAEE